MIPIIMSANKYGKNTGDIFSADFSENRRIWLDSEIDRKFSTEIILQIEYLSAQSKEPIVMYINSPGGEVFAGLAIYDAMNRCGCDVITVATGLAASMAAFLFSSGRVRYITPMAEVMIHQPLGGTAGQASDIDLAARRIMKMKRKLNVILAENTGKSLKTITKDTDRDYSMDAEEAVKYGIADYILTENL